MPVSDAIDNHMPATVTRRRALLTGLAAPSILLPACGGGGDENPVANLRFVNATSEAGPLDVYIDGVREVRALPARSTSTGYGRTSADGASVEVTGSGSPTPLGRFTASAPANTLNTGVLLGNAADGLVYRQLAETEPLGDPASTRLRLLNGLPGTDRHQLFLTAELDPVTPGQELFSSRQFNELGAFRSVNSARYRVRIIRNGDPAAVVFDFTGLTLTGGESGTWILAPVPGTGQVSLALFMQGASGLVLTNQLP